MTLQSQKRIAGQTAAGLSATAGENGARCRKSSSALEFDERGDDGGAARSLPIPFAEAWHVYCNSTGRVEFSAGASLSGNRREGGLSAALL
jgi:hypothetical protein